MKIIDTDQILERVKIALSLKTDTELANALGLKKATISNWRTRKSIDYNLVFSICEQYNLDWIVSGRGSMTLDPINNQGESNYAQLLEKVILQAEEIGKLKERNNQLEREKESMEVELKTKLASLNA